MDLPEIEQHTQGWEAGDIEALRYIINSPAWDNFFKPFLIQLGRDLQGQLADPSLKRKADRPDDFLRGAIHTARALLFEPYRIVHESDHEAAAQALIRSAEAEYEGRTMQDDPFGDAA